MVLTRGGNGMDALRIIYTLSSALLDEVQFQCTYLDVFHGAVGLQLVGLVAWLMKGHVGEHVGVANERSYQRDRFFSWELQRETEMSKMPAYAIRNSKNFQGNHKPLLARNLQEARAESRPKLIKQKFSK